MTDTTHLGLPFIEGSQAQKHVTHNEALRILDSVVQIGVLDTNRTTPPSSPAEGDRHIVASGASGAWAGHAKAVAVREDGTWRFLVPKSGWCAWSDADGALLVYDGTAWTEATGGGSMSGSVALLGVNDAASAPNLLTVKSNAALFNAVAVAGGGTGDMRVQISKEASAKTASVVFSDAFSSRAEFGLIGSDAFKLKVSNDGTTFVEALAIDQTSGNAALARGIALTGVISPSQITSNQNDYNPTGIASASMMNLSSDALRSVSGLASGAEGRVIALLNTGSQPILLLNESGSSTAANRFTLGSDLVIGAKQAAILRYDGTAARWYIIARPGGREMLVANRTYYVRTDGSNSNDGRSNTSGGAFLTIQKAIDVVAALDISIFDVTINVADGTYTGATLVSGPWIGSGSVSIVGNTTTPANVVINPASGGCFTTTGGGFLIVSGMELRGQFGLVSQRGSRIYGTSSLRFGASTNYHVWANGGQIVLFNNYSIVGGAQVHFLADGGGQLSATGLTVTLTGTPAFSVSYANAGSVGTSILCYSNTFSGSATGTRYIVQQGALINTNGGGTSYLPGNAAGSGTNFGASPWGLYQ